MLECEVGAHEAGIWYSVPSKDNTFLEILISAVKSTFSPFIIKASKNSFGEVFSKFIFSPYITNGEAIEVQKRVKISTK